MNNSGLPIRLGILIATHTATWVEESQPVQWRPDAWRRYWRENGLPCSHVLDELEAEYSSQGTIRRKFILDTYQDRPATELFIAVMAWGSGPDNRGPAKAGGILKQDQASAKIEDTVSVVRQAGAAAGYRAYYARNRLENLDVAFVTKLLYFAGYRSPHRPRPLIYDSLVATAAARFPNAPASHRRRRHDIQLPALLRLGRGHRRGAPDRARRHRVVPLRPRSRHPRRATAMTPPTYVICLTKREGNATRPVTNPAKLHRANRQAQSQHGIAAHGECGQKAHAGHPGQRARSCIRCNIPRPA